MTSPLPPIASPARRRWREFRIEVLPGIAFVCIVGAALAVWRDYVPPDRPADPVDTNVVTTASTPTTLPPAGR